MDIKALAKEAEAYIIDRRRHFHQHPELSFKEWETTKTIVAELEAMADNCIAFSDDGRGVQNDEKQNRYNISWNLGVAACDRRFSQSADRNCSGRPVSLRTLAGIF